GGTPRPRSAGGPAPTRRGRARRTARAPPGRVGGVGPWSLSPQGRAEEVELLLVRRDQDQVAERADRRDRAPAVGPLEVAPLPGDRAARGVEHPELGAVEHHDQVAVLAHAEARPGLTAAEG